MATILPKKAGFEIPTATDDAQHDMLAADPSINQFPQGSTYEIPMQSTHHSEDPQQETSAHLAHQSQTVSDHNHLAMVAALVAVQALEHQRVGSVEQQTTRDLLAQAT